MRIIICDAGPIIHLHEAGILSILRNAGEIFLPHSVFVEVIAATNLADNWPEWLQVEQLASSELKEAETWAKTGDLHKGEAEAFVFGENKKSGLVVDRRFCCEIICYFVRPRSTWFFGYRTLEYSP